MVWNPRKAALRAGNVSSAIWDDANIGLSSVALGNNPSASGSASVAIGNFVTASGTGSSAFGTSSSALGQASTVFGRQNIANASESTAFGYSNNASSYGETVLGIGATLYTPSFNGATQFRPANATDRLFVIGNAIDINSNGAVEFGERSNAMIVLKNGLTRLPSTTNAMIDAADGKAIVTKEFLQTNSSGTLDQAYDFGGAGSGRTITADTGAVIIDGTDGLVSTGTLNTGAIAPSGAGVKMFWNPRKAAFRAGNVNATQWDDGNIGNHTTAFGFATTASGDLSIAFGQSTSAIGSISTAYGDNTNANGTGSTAFGQSTSANGGISTAFGVSTTANGTVSTAFGQQNIANGNESTVFGRQNTASSYAETVMGIGATNYTPSTNGDSQFRVANATDRLFVVGNAIDTNNNNTVDDSERSDALVVLKNGNTGIGTSIPVRKLHVLAGTSTGVTPFSGAPFVLESNGDAYQQFLTPNVSAATGSGLLFGTTTGAIRGGVVFAALDEKLDFRTGGNTARMTILNSGFLVLEPQHQQENCMCLMVQVEAHPMVTQGYF